MKSYQQYFRLSFSSISLWLLIHTGCFASRYMASDFGWYKVGQDSFLITLTIYKDCNGGSLGTAKIYFKCASTNSIFDSLLIAAPSGTEVTPVCSSQTRCQSSSSTFPYGISRYIYQGIIYLNNAGSCCSIRMCYQDTNRNSNITTGAASQSFYTEAVFNRCISPDDNGPTFSKLPIEILCVGRDNSNNPGIIDQDTNSFGKNDSIVCEWTPPLKSYNNPTTYYTPYNYYNPVYVSTFPNPNGINLDPQTGEIQFRPMKAEVTIMAIKFKQYRNGTLISEVRRDIQTTILTCPNITPPSITTQNNVRTKSVCADNTVTFSYTSYDPNSYDTVIISWNNAIPGATFTTTNGQAQFPTATFSWTPPDSLISSLPYTFTVTAMDNACPIHILTTQAYQVTVKANPAASLTVIDSGCGTYWFSAQRISGTNPGYFWNGGNFNFMPNNGTLVSHKFKNGIYPYSLTMTSNGCSTYYTDTIVADTFIWNTLPPDTTVCPGSTVTLTSNIVNNSGPVKMLWGSGKTVFTSDTVITKSFTVTRDTVIWSIASDSTGCESFDSIIIKIRKPIGLTLSPDLRLCSNEHAQLLASYIIDSNAVSSIIWKEINSNKIVGYDSLLITSDSGLYVCTVTDTFGCTDFDTVKFVKNPEVIASAIAQLICIGDEAELQADSTGAGNAWYFWYEGTIRIGNTQKIKVKPLSTTDYLLKVIETTAGVACSDSLKVRVRVNPLPVIKISAIDKRCVNGSIISLNNYVTVNGNPTSLGKWSSSSNGLLYVDKFNPVVSGASTAPGWKVIFEYTDPGTECYNKDSDYVTVFDLPKPFAGFDESVCRGTKKALSGLPLIPPGTWRGIGVEGSYPVWKFNPDAPGIIDGVRYDVIYHYMDNNNCENEDTAKYSVNSKPPLPVISLTPSNSQLECNLTNGSYKWFYRPVIALPAINIDSNSRQINPKTYCQNCYFSVIFTDSNGCISDTSASYHFLGNSIENSNQNTGFRFYPNPAHSQLFIENPSFKTSSIILTNILGNILLQTNIKPGKNELSLTNFKPGIYFIFMDRVIAGKVTIE